MLGFDVAQRFSRPSSFSEQQLVSPQDTCNGQLALVDCQHPSAEWLSSGALLYSAPCWTQGHSAALTVNEDCTSLGLSLAGNGTPTPITRAQSFMLLEPSFVETIVDDTSADEGGSDSSGGDLGSEADYPSVSTPAPPITLTECGESFTDEKVVLSEDLNCGPFNYTGDNDYEDYYWYKQDCAVWLSGPFAELDCDHNTLFQEADPEGRSYWFLDRVSYNDGPFENGICLRNGAKAINCNVQRFITGIVVTDDGEVVNSDLSSNHQGIRADFDFNADSTATVTIENT